MFHYDQGVKRVRTFVINVKQGCLTSFRKWQSGMMVVQETTTVMTMMMENDNYYVNECLDKDNKR